MNFLGLPPLPSALKSISPYLQRAEELKSQDCIMSYWCAYYATHMGILLKAQDAASRDVLSELLRVLERMKNEIGVNDAVDLEASSYAYVEKFAHMVYAAADKNDRGGIRDKTTARKFLAAADYLEVLKVFPNTGLSKSNEEKFRHANWKAAEIAVELRDRRKHTAGSACSRSSSLSPDDTHSTSTGTVITPTTTPSPSVPPSPRSSGKKRAPLPHANDTAPHHRGESKIRESGRPHASSNWSNEACCGDYADKDVRRRSDKSSGSTGSPRPSHSSPRSNARSTPNTPPRSPRVNVLPQASPAHPASPLKAGLEAALTPRVIAKAQKHARFAISALNYEDAEQSKRELRNALEILGEEVI